MRDVAFPIVQHTGLWPFGLILLFSTQSSGGQLMKMFGCFHGFETEMVLFVLTCNSNVLRTSFKCIYRVLA